MIPLHRIRRQSTLASPAILAGTALHDGTHARLALRPAPPDTGLVFVRTDVSDRDNAVLADPSNVSNTRNCTVLRNGAGVEVSTVEHLLAALACAGVDNLFIDISARELPALDGSSAPFSDMVERVGVQPQAAPRRYVRVLKTFRVQHGDAFAEIAPAERLELDVSIDFDDPAIGQSRMQYAPDERSFRDHIASARTFARQSDVAALHRAGLAKGGSLRNAVVVDAGRVLNPEGLRFPDEFVRHKVLDLLGDLYLGGPLLARVRTHAGGHALNHALMGEVYRDPQGWRFEGVDAPLAAAE